MINVGIVGVSGYSGGELLKLLLNHREVRVTYVSANNTTGPIDELWPEIKGKLKLNCEKYNHNDAVSKCDVMFLAVPHTVSMSITPKLLQSKVKVIDLSGDYRLKKSAEYKKWYGASHADLKNLRKAVYGLPELYRQDIRKAQLIANPGCYPTAALLGLIPLISVEGKNIASITIDAKSGVSGAGKKAKIDYHLCELGENFKAYKVLNHQHAPEINQFLHKIDKTTPAIEFVPHLLPIKRGILETIYVKLNKKTTLNKIQQLYKRFYKTEPFVRVMNSGVQPEIKNVAHSNYCDIGLSLNSNKDLLVITSVIDNLSKGAASQAVQNMNIMQGFEESEAIA